MRLPHFRLPATLKTAISAIIVIVIIIIIIIIIIYQNRFFIYSSINMGMWILTKQLSRHNIDLLIQQICVIWYWLTALITENISLIRPI